MSRKTKILALWALAFLGACTKPNQNREFETSKGYNVDMTDEQMLDFVQKQTFQYFWDGAEPNSGLARERYHADNIYPQNDASTVTSGGSGFGLMTLLVGIERGYISREEGVARFEKILNFLETADRFHGAWPHWWYGETGKVKPFSKNDDGGDLVETSFMAQGLLCAREYFKEGSDEEQKLAARMDKLWREIEFNWYTNEGESLFWHWSPDKGWAMNFQVHGYNECLIMYVLAAASPTYSIDKSVYDAGWAEHGRIMDVHEAFNGMTLQARHQSNPQNGGPLFWAHYSFLGLNPTGLKDEYVDYGTECVNQAKINHDWCTKNPHAYKGYSSSSWGLTSSYSMKGYAGHAPSMERDLGVIAPTAAVSSIVYTPEESLAAMRNWLANKPALWGKYGFYDAFSESADWMLPRYLAIDQGPMVPMIENYRSGMLWKLFMQAPEVQKGLKKLGFTSPYIE
ncbi:beta-glucosidase [Marinilongibacter aquaticus]|uniref:glucoamylase family protein n=1 Tax=Marinilongibacter aquaticus TaxID=2975157 RepID=UPI0021BD480E|nr:glucoamylase family protein [Marinilongibacter aquaticus]UBM59043.1 beta-glucosidase [Marinilongibacter aquaticus]